MCRPQSTTLQPQIDIHTYIEPLINTPFRANDKAKNNPNNPRIIAAHTMQQRSLNALLGHSGLCRHVPWSGNEV